MNDPIMAYHLAMACQSDILRQAAEDRRARSYTAPTRRGLVDRLARLLSRGQASPTQPGQEATKPLALTPRNPEGPRAA